MAITISNQATAIYTTCGREVSTVSNTATAQLMGTMCLSKTAYDDFYRPGQLLTYLIHIQNGGELPTAGLVIRDDLGSFTEGGVTVTPLSYRSYQLYLDGVLNETVPVSVSLGQNGVTFSFGALPSDFSLLTLVYQAEVNEYAPFDPHGGRITNTSSLFSGNTLLDADSAISKAGCYAELTIEKSMSPNPVENGAPITYRFLLRNFGSDSPTAVTLQDIFLPQLQSPLQAVTVNGALTNNYSYDPLTGEFLLGASASPAFGLTVPAATAVRDPSTGVYTVTPGETIVTVTGRIQL